MNRLRCTMAIFIAVLMSVCSSTVSGQVTQIIKTTDIIRDPGDPKTVVGRLYPGTEIRKTGKDPTGKFIKATVEFYIPLQTLKEGRVAKRVGEWQEADDATIKLLTAERKDSFVTVSVAIVNQSKENMDMSALLLFRLVDSVGNLGNLEFMESKNSVGIIEPGKTLQSELVYSFPQSPEDLELSFQSKLGGDQVFFMLGF